MKADRLVGQEDMFTYKYDNANFVEDLSQKTQNRHFQAMSTKVNEHNKFYYSNI